MARRRSTPSEGSTTKRRADVALPQRHPRDAVTLRSVLESFLLHKITLDDTVTVEALGSALGDAAATTKPKIKASRTKKKDIQSHPSVPYFAQDLNLQRRALRKEVEANIDDFVEAYTASLRAAAKASVDGDDDQDGDGDEDGEEYASEDDEQMDLLRESWSVRDAIVKLREARDTLSQACEALLVTLDKQKKDLSRSADALANLL